MKQKELESKRKINYNLLLAIAINLIFLILVIVFCDTKYEVSDDFVMDTILSGAYGGKENPHIIFVNIIWGYFLLPFYKLFPGISWYLISQLVLCFCSFVAVTYMLLEKLEKPIACMLAVLFIAFFSDDLYILVQFTKTAIFAIMAGSIFFLWGVFRRKNKKIIVCGSLLVICGSLIRFNGIYIAGSFLIISIVFELVSLAKREKKDLLKQMGSSVALGVILILIVLGLHLVNDGIYQYQVKEGYRDYYQYNKARGRIIDYSTYGYWVDETRFKKMGISENDYKMLTSWNFADNKVFSKKNMQEIAAILRKFRKTEKLSNTYIMELVKGRRYYTYTIFWGCMLLVVISLLYNKKLWITLMLNAGIAIALIYYFGYVERFVYRVEFGIFICFFLGILYFWDSKKKNSKKNIKTVKKICVILVVVLGICKLPLYVPDYSYSEMDNLEYREYINNLFNYSWNYDVRKYRCNVKEGFIQPNIIKEMESNPQNFYFMDFHTTIQTLYLDYSPIFTCEKGYYKNFLYLAGVTTNFPDINRILQENNLKNPLMHLIDENVYVIDNVNEDKKLQYLKEHGYANAKKVLTKTVDGYKIWKYCKN